MIEVSIYRYNPETDKFPYMQKFKFTPPEREIMVLELLTLLKEEDPTLSFRRSCREGVCGSDGMSIKMVKTVLRASLLYLMFSKKTKLIFGRYPDYQ